MNAAHAPQSGGRGFLALLICVAAFAALLMFETERFAALDRFRERDLGPALIGHLYSPWASLEWMFKYDISLNPFMEDTRHEPLWAHEAFEKERRELMWGGGVILVGGMVLSIAFIRPRANSDLHGSSGWATRADLSSSSLTKFDGGVVLGQTRSKSLLTHWSSENTLVLGPPGEGKSELITATLHMTPGISAIVVDPAYELTPRTAKLRADSTGIVVFDPRNPQTAQYNPLAGIPVGDVDAVRAVMAAYLLERDLAEMTEQERYFNGSALELGTAIVAHAIELGTPTLEAAARHYYSAAWTSDHDFCESLLKSNIEYVNETASKYCRMDAKALSGIISTLTQSLDVFRIPGVARATGASTIAPADLRKSPTTFYLVMRGKDRAWLIPLMRLLLTGFLNDLTESKPRTNAHIMLLVDEFPALRTPIIARKLAEFRKYLIHPVLAAQSLSQILSYYGPHEEISGLCDVRVFFPSVDAPTQDLASRTCGNVTRWTESYNRGSDGKASRTVHEVGRPLLFPDDLARMKATNEIVVYKKGERPIRARPVRTYADKRFRSGRPDDGAPRG